MDKQGVIVRVLTPTHKLRRVRQKKSYSGSAERTKLGYSDGGVQPEQPVGL